MATVELTDDSDPRVRAVFDDIRATRGSPFINNFWRGLANDPALLERSWATLKAVMGEGALDPLTKELIYVAVSIANGCAYCIHSHTAAARAKGLTPQQHGEFLAVVGMANQTNALVTGMQLPVDEAFLVGEAAKNAGRVDPVPTGDVGAMPHLPTIGAGGPAWRRGGNTS